MAARSSQCAASSLLGDVAAFGETHGHLVGRRRIARHGGGRSAGPPIETGRLSLAGAAAGWWRSSRPAAAPVFAEAVTSGETHDGSAPDDGPWSVQMRFGFVPGARPGLPPDGAFGVARRRGLAPGRVHKWGGLSPAAEDLLRAAPRSVEMPSCVGSGGGPLESAVEHARRNVQTTDHDQYRCARHQQLA